MEIQFSERTKQAVNGMENETKEKSQDITWKQLFKEVGAKIIYKNKKPILRFDPPLDGPKIDPERWEKALKLEEYFWEKVSNS